MSGNKRSLVLGVFFAALAGLAVLLYAGSKVGGLSFVSKTASEVESGLGSEILFMPTPGGLLEVSKFQMTEQFDKTFVYSVLGHEVGKTVAHIRVPATYRYHIELAPRWKVVRTGAEFKVVTPPVKPSLPVAVDLARMQKDEGGSWALVPFSREDDLNALEREITGKLAEKAASSDYYRQQQELAKKTVTEFVEKWLVTQESWKAAQQPRIEVVFGE